MPTTDDRLRDAGAAWRTQVDAGAAPSAAEANLRTLRHAEHDARRRRTTLRRRAGLSAIALGAAAVVAGVMALADPFDGGWSGGSSASCVGPQLAVGRSEQPGHERSAEATVVRRGQTLTVNGHYYVTDCYDTGQHGDPPAYRTVRLSLTSATDTVPLVTVHPDHDGAFITTVRVPADFPTGPATLRSDVDVAPDLDLIVAAATPAP